MKKIYLGFKFAFSYFSIFPISFKKDDDLGSGEVLKYTLFFLPFVGFVLSGLSGTLYNFLEPVWFNAIFCALLYMFLYGFIHTEAISDVADAVYAAHSGKDPYEIIKEPHIGAMGMLYTASLLILKVAALTYLFMEQMVLEVMIIALLSRLSILFIVYFNEFRSSFVSALKSKVDNSILFSASLFYGMIIFLILGIKGFVLIITTLIISLVVIRSLKRKLGFLNGDVLGFNIEIIEILSMIFLIQYYLTI